MGKPGFKIVQHVGKDPLTGLPQVTLHEFDVVKGDGEKVNPAPLSPKAAERLLKKLWATKDPEEPREDIMPESGEKIKWKKLGGGTFRLQSGKIIKPNQVFDAYVSEIPKAFRDVVVPLDPLPEDVPLTVTSGDYQVKSRGPGWYDVFDAFGKRVNEQALRQPEAEKLAEELMK